MKLEAPVRNIANGAGGVFCGDTWHETLDDAKEQTLVEYKIGNTDRKTETPP